MSAAESASRLTPRDLLDRMFGIDVRALAVFRMGVAVILLYDLVSRAMDFEAHYTDFGVLPYADMLANHHDRWTWTIHALGGGMWWPAALFAVAGVLAAMMLVGWHTKIATVGSWALLVSLHVRNPLILQGGDVLLRALLFWSMFLPLGAVWSLDAWRRRDKAERDIRILSVATAALLMQVAFVYISSGFLKTHAIWEVEGSAIFYALNLDAFATPIGLALLPHRTLLKWMSFATLYLERFGPLVAFVPWLHTPLRLIVVALFWGLHLGLIATMRLGHFPYVCLIAWVPFLPTAFWNWVDLRLPRSIRGRYISSSPYHECVYYVYGTVQVTIQCGLALLLSYVIVWNLRETWPRQCGLMKPPALLPVMLSLRLDQSWGMFAPYPLRDDGWFVMPGTLANGREVDLWSPDKPLTDDKPDVAAFYPNERWRKYLFNLWLKQYSAGRPPFLKWLRRRWDREVAKSPDEKCVKAELKYWLELSTLGDPEPLEEVKLAEIGGDGEQSTPAQENKLRTPD